jgi:hypothetical protein
MTGDLGWSQSDREYGGWGYALGPPRKPATGQTADPAALANLSATAIGLGALATCVSSGGEVLPDARVVLLYDERNPAFRPGGDGRNSYQRVRGMLHEPRMLQRTTWQRVTELLHGDTETHWLAAKLDAKYGFLGAQESQP